MNLCYMFMDNIKIKELLILSYKKSKNIMHSKYHNCSNHRTNTVLLQI